MIFKTVTLHGMTLYRVLEAPMTESERLEIRVIKMLNRSWPLEIRVKGCPKRKIVKKNQYFFFMIYAYRILDTQLHKLTQIIAQIITP